MLRSTVAAPVSLLEKLPLCLNPVKFIQPLAGAPFQAAVAAPPTLVQQVKALVQSNYGVVLEPEPRFLPAV